MPSKESEALARAVAAQVKALTSKRILPVDIDGPEPER